MERKDQVTSSLLISWDTLFHLRANSVINIYREGHLIISFVCYFINLFYSTNECINIVILNYKSDRTRMPLNHAEMITAETPICQ